jgi:cell division protein FtsI (penicillin-binding protein 3)
VTAPRAGGRRPAQAPRRRPSTAPPQARPRGRAPSRTAATPHRPRFGRPDRSHLQHPLVRRRSASPRRRLAFLAGLAVVLFAALLVKVAVLQVADHDSLTAYGEAQRVDVLPVPAARGALLDRNGAALALSLPQQTVWADPSLVTDPEGAAEVLAPLLWMTPAEVEADLSQPGEFTYLARQMSDDRAELVSDAVEQHDLDGIFFQTEQARFTPDAELARGVLGRVGVDNVGVSGLEGQYDELLSGTPGEVRLERGADGETIPGGAHEVTDADQGDDLTLTLDRSLQHATERALATQVDATGAQGGIAIVSDPRTGELLAMANVVRAEDGSVVPSSNNSAVTAVFEPGSVNKVITMAAALEEGLVDPGTMMTVPDSIQVSDHLFTDHDPHPTASWSVTDVLAQSSNVGTIQLAQQLGSDRLDQYLRDFGFGDSTGLGFPNEVPGLMLDLEDWSGTSIGSIPLGQGISVTALQMLTAYNAIANDGVLVEPRLVSGTVEPDGTTHPTDPADERRVISEDTAVQLQSMLAEAVRAGTGAEAAIPSYDVAGKTGTARKPQPEGGYEDAGGNYHYVSSFAGFAPAQDPALSAIVVIDAPTSSIFGGDVAAPVFSQIAQEALRRLHIPPPATGDPNR